MRAAWPQIKSILLLNAILLLSACDWFSDDEAPSPTPNNPSLEETVTINGQLAFPAVVMASQVKLYRVGDPNTAIQPKPDGFYELTFTRNSSDGNAPTLYAVASDANVLLYGVQIPAIAISNGLGSAPKATLTAIGRLDGKVSLANDVDTNNVQVGVAGTRLQTTIDAKGRYSLVLPEGQWQIVLTRQEATGIQTFVLETVTITAAEKAKAHEVVIADKTPIVRCPNGQAILDQACQEHARCTENQSYEPKTNRCIDALAPSTQATIDVDAILNIGLAIDAVDEDLKKQWVIASVSPADNGELTIRGLHRVIYIARSGERDQFTVILQHGDGRRLQRKINVTIQHEDISAPILTTISPSNARSRQDVTLTGSGFKEGISVSVGDAPCDSVDVLSETILQCTLGQHRFGPVVVTIRNSDGQASQLSDAFRYNFANVKTLIGPLSKPVVENSINGDFQTSRFNAIACTTYANGVLYASESAGHSVRRIDLSTKQVTTLAGNGTHGDENGIPGQLNRPACPLLGPNATFLYVADSDNNQIRRIRLADGNMSVFAGADDHVADHVDGEATSARFNSPFGLAIYENNLYVSDLFNFVIRRINLDTALVETFAGTAQESDYRDGRAAAAAFRAPAGLAIIGSILYIADRDSATIRAITLDGVAMVSTVAGIDLDNGLTAGVSMGDDPRFAYPNGLTHDGTYLYISDTTAATIRRFDPKTGTLNTLSGRPQSLIDIDGRIEIASFGLPQTLSYAQDWGLFVSMDSRIRLIE